MLLHIGLHLIHLILFLHPDDDFNTTGFNYDLNRSALDKISAAHRVVAVAGSWEDLKFRDMADCDVDNIIDQLLGVRGARPGRQVNLTENEIKWLCTKGRELFQSQPVLLELEAPIKVSSLGWFTLGGV